VVVVDSLTIKISRKQVSNMFKNLLLRPQIICAVVDRSYIVVRRWLATTTTSGIDLSAIICDLADRLAVHRSQQGRKACMYDRGLSC